MPYTTEKPPEWLKNLPKGAIRIGVEIFNKVLAEKDDEDQARKAAWSAIKAKYEKGEDGKWHARQGQNESQRKGILEVDFQAAEPKDAKGLVWEAVLIAPGLTAPTMTGIFYYEEEVLERAAELFTGADLCVYEIEGDLSHVDEDLFYAKRYLIRNKAGWIKKSWYEKGVGIKAEIHVLETEDWLRKVLLEGHSRGNDAVLGISVDTRIRGVLVEMEGWDIVWVLEILQVSSVDVVTRPAAGGKFLRAVASARQNEEEHMEKWLKLIQEKRPDLLAGKDLEQITEDEVMDLARMAIEEPRPQGNPNPASGAAPQAVSTEELAQQAIQAAQQKIDEWQRLQDERAAFAEMLDEKLKASELPEFVQKRLRARFKSQIIPAEEVDRAIAEEKDYLAQMAAAHGAGQVSVDGQVRSAQMGITSLQKAQIAMDKTFGLTGEKVVELGRMTRLDGQSFFQEEHVPEEMRAVQSASDYDGVPGFRGLREMYEFFSGDRDVSGFFLRKNLPAELRARMDITSSTFTYVLANTLARRLVSEYREAAWKEELLISIRKPVRDFRTQEAVLIGGFPNLSTVDPEAADYDEIAGITDEEVTYAIAQKGNILTISRKTIINDDISVVQRVVNKLGRAARRTHGEYVWGKWIDNENCTDGTAWHTSGHGNYATGALTHSTAYTAWVALAKMTEKDSGKRLGLLVGEEKLNLVGPPDLMNTMKKIETEEFYYSTNDLTDKVPNPLVGLVKANVLPVLTDTDDWGMLLPPNLIEHVEMGYLNGREEPEYFVADGPQSEQMFVADKLRHKIRHEYAGAPVDYRGSYKAEV